MFDLNFWYINWIKISFIIFQPENYIDNIIFSYLSRFMIYSILINKLFDIDFEFLQVYWMLCRVLLGD